MTLFSPALFLSVFYLIYVFFFFEEEENKEMFVPCWEKGPDIIVAAAAGRGGVHL